MSKKEIRRKFKSDVHTRDKYTCLCCGVKGTDETLDAHHITDRNEMPNGGYVKENGITLCVALCHMKAEKFHITGGKEWESGMHPNDLYLKISSSYEQAVRASERLK